MRNLIRNPWFIAGAIVVAAVGFYLFRPDTLFVDDAVDESLDEAFATETTVTSTSQPPTTTTPDTDDAATATTEATAPTTTTEAPSPVAELVGNFYGIDHRAEGTATVYESDGARVLRFEDDTDIQNGPDLHVWLVPDADYTEGTPADFIDLGLLKGNVGGQNYELPADFDPTGEWYVLVWCKRFSVPFAAAPLA